MNYFKNFKQLLRCLVKESIFKKKIILYNIVKILYKKGLKMKKKFWFIMLILGVFTAVGCSKTESSKKEIKYYDNDFITALQDGLVSRWDEVDKEEKKENFKESGSSYKKWVDLELTQIKKFEDLKFKDSKLKEYAISYINELKEGEKISETFGSESFDGKWYEHQNRRTELLVNINKIHKLKVPNEEKETLKELLAGGKEVEQNNKNEQVVKDFVNKIEFARNEEKSDEYTSYYEVTVENTTGLTIKELGIEVKLIDANGVVVDTKYINATNWTKNEKRLLEFMAFEDFAKTEYVVSYQETE